MVGKMGLGKLVEHKTPLTVAATCDSIDVLLNWYSCIWRPVWILVVGWITALPPLCCFYWVMRGVWGGSSILGQQQQHKCVRHHILTQNLKTLGLWVLTLVYYYSLFTFSSNVRLLSHTSYTTISPSSVSHSFIWVYVPLKWKLFYPYILATSLISTTSTGHVAWPPLPRRLSTQRLGRTIISYTILGFFIGLKFTFQSRFCKIELGLTQSLTWYQSRVGYDHVTCPCASQPLSACTTFQFLVTYVHRCQLRWPF